MELQFCLALATSIVLLVAPGCLVLRGLRCSTPVSLSCAAPLSICLYVIMGTLLSLVGLRGAPVLLGSTVTVAATIWLAGARPLARNAHGKAPDQTSSKHDLAVLAVAAAVGLATIYVVFASYMGGAATFVQFDDNVSHLGMIASMVEGGDYSALSTSSYPATLPDGQAPFDNRGYYPNGWHVVAALSCWITRSGTAVAENATNVALAAVIYPLGMVGFLRTALHGRGRNAAACGAFTCLASAAFPLRMLTVHGAFPNFAAFCLVPAVCHLFMEALPARQDEPLVRVRCLALFAIAGVGLAMTHPNAVFTCALVLAPLVIMRLVPRWMGAWRKRRPHRPLPIHAVQVLVALAGAALWAWLDSSDVMPSVVNFVWRTLRPLDEVLFDVISAGYHLQLPQVLLAALILVGFAGCARRKDTAWLAVSYLLVATVFTLGLSTDFELRKLFTGFWYNDPERTAAMLALAAAPLSATGLHMTCHALAALTRRLVGPRGDAQPAACAYVPALCAIALFTAGNYFVAKESPVTGGETAFSFSTGQVVGTYTFAADQSYDRSEKNFVEKVKQLVGEDALVINMPFDGSVFSYPSEGLNVYYKSCRPDEETPESLLVRHSLNRIADDEEVREAVRSTGARYVLVLGGIDRTQDKQTELGFFWSAEWEGLQLDDATPGFATLLAEGDLRLYEILAS